MKKLTTDRIIAEQQILASCLANPDLIKRLTQDHFLVENNRAIYSIISEVSRTHSPHISLIYSENKERVPEYEITSLQHFIEKHRIDKDSAQMICEGAVRKIAALNKLDEAAHYIGLAAEQIAKENLAGAMIYSSRVKTASNGEFSDTVYEMASSLEKMRTFQTGIQTIDELLGGFPYGNLISVCGDTGSMKTMITMHLCLSILEHNPQFRIVYFEKEMPKSDLMRRIILHYIEGVTNIDLIEASKPYNEEKRKSLKSLILDLDKSHPMLKRFKVVAPDDFETAEDMMNIICEFGANVWCLDYMSLLHGNSSDTSEKAYSVMSNMAKFKDIVHKTDSTGIVISQLSKGTVEKRGIKIPMMDDIEWSSDIKKLSAFVFTTFYPRLYLENNPNLTDKSLYYLLCLKNRFEKPFTVPFSAKPEVSNFSEMYEKHESDFAMQFLKGYVSGGL